VDWDYRKLEYDMKIEWLQEVEEKIYYGIQLTDHERMQLVKVVEENLRELKALAEIIRELEEEKGDG